MNKTEIINALIQSRGYKSYLEIGCDIPDNNFNKIKCDIKESVDPYLECPPYLTKKNFQRFIQLVTYKMTSDQFFEQNQKKYDIIFIDGLHLEDQVAHDIVNSMKSLNKGGIIVIHDCLPRKEKFQSENRTTIEWNGSAWKAVASLNQLGVSFHVIDADYGCAIIPKAEIKYIPKSNLTWNDFIKSRNELMNVITKNQFRKIYL
jgi:hypothetical protein